MTAKKAARTRSTVDHASPGAPLDAKAVRERLVGKVLSSAEDIVQQVIEAAKTGNYLPAKFLFEFAGIMEPSSKMEGDAEAQERLRSLAEMLLDAAQGAPEATSPESAVQ